MHVASYIVMFNKINVHQVRSSGLAEVKSGRSDLPCLDEDKEVFDIKEAVEV